MNTVVVDASVAAKWVLPPHGEDLVPEALRLLDSYAQGQIRFLVPDLFWAEFGNVLWKAVRQQRLTSATAVQAVNAMRSRGFPCVASERLLAEALAVALSTGGTVYDSLYVALAMVSKSQFVTADEKLANSLAARLPVKWLGAY
ncbi:MAG TPA: type II toxin-antitoxin system VapC family toxin [Terriglobales bacterium]|jgi:predicted nucleic acid-binding protein|nr:type II toxin-antitoxin system VapC family toxin [Terriglobales bacterium]